jgi:hypothetical protein
MPIARIVLTSKGPSTHTRRGRKFLRGQPQTLTSNSEIEYYKNEYGFSVTYLSGSGSQIEKKQEEKQEQKEEDEIYTKDSLKEMKKSVLQTIASKFNIPLIGNEKKKAIIESILLAQEEDDEEDE